MYYFWLKHCANLLAAFVHECELQIITDVVIEKICIREVVALRACFGKPLK